MLIPRRQRLFFLVQKTNKLVDLRIFNIHVLRYIAGVRSAVFSVVESAGNLGAVRRHPGNILIFGVPLRPH